MECQSDRLLKSNLMQVAKTSHRLDFRSSVLGGVVSQQLALTVKSDETYLFSAQFLMRRLNNLGEVTFIA